MKCSLRISGRLLTWTAPAHSIASGVMEKDSVGQTETKGNPESETEGDECDDQ